MNVIRFPVHRTTAHRAAAMGNTRYPGWSFEVVTSEDGAESIAVSMPSGDTVGIHPGPSEWGIVDDQGYVLGVHHSVADAMMQLVG